jgi:hypothetical protein
MVAAAAAIGHGGASGTRTDRYDPRCAQRKTTRRRSNGWNLWSLSQWSGRGLSPTKSTRHTGRSSPFPVVGAVFEERFAHLIERMEQYYSICVFRKKQWNAIFKINKEEFSGTVI